MNDAEYEATKSEVERCIDIWKPRLRLNDWTLASRHYRTAAIYEKERPQDVGSCACCAVQWQYMYATMHFNEEDLIADDEGIEAIVVHEMSHILVGQMHYEAWPHIPEPAHSMWNGNHERVTTMIANALLKTRDDAKAYKPVEGEY